MKEALGLYLYIREQCDEMTTRKQAAGLEEACLLLLDRPEETLELLGRNAVTLLRDERTISPAYRSMGEEKKAGVMPQVSIYQHMMAMVDDSISYLYLSGDGRVVLKETWRRLQEMFETFHMEKLKPAAALQACVVAADTFSKNGEEERTIKLLGDYPEPHHSCGDVSKLHGDVLFDKVEGWLEETVIGSGLMKSQRVV